MLAETSKFIVDSSDYSNKDKFKWAGVRGIKHDNFSVKALRALTVFILFELSI